MAVSEMKPVRRKFKKEWLIALLEEFANDEAEIVKDTVDGTRRWSVDHWLVFKLRTDGTYWGVSYSVGATEMQDEAPWEYDGDEIECTQLERKEVVKVDYVVVKL